MLVIDYKIINLIDNNVKRNDKLASTSKWHVERKKKKGKEKNEWSINAEKRAAAFDLNPWITAPMTDGRRVIKPFVGSYFFFNAIATLLNDVCSF